MLWWQLLQGRVWLRQMFKDRPLRPAARATSMRLPAPRLGVPALSRWPQGSSYWPVHAAALLTGPVCWPLGADLVLGGIAWSKNQS